MSIKRMTNHVFPPRYMELPSTLSILKILLSLPHAYVASFNVFCSALFNDRKIDFRFSFLQI